MPEMQDELFNCNCVPDAPNQELRAEWKIVHSAVANDEFKRLLELNSLVLKLGLHRHPSNTSEKPHVQRAATLLRFLRARAGNVEKAAEMLTEALDWRRDFALDQKLSAWRAELAEGQSARAKLLKDFGYIQQLCLDLDGNPVSLQRFSQGDPGGLVREVGSEAFLLYLLDQLESSLELAQQRMMSSGCLFAGFLEVIDVGNYGLVGEWHGRGRSAIGPYCKFAGVFDKLYPERLRVAFIVRAPAAFSLVWKLVLPFIPEATRQKIRIKGHKSSTWKAEMAELVSLEELPRWLKEDDPAAFLEATPAGGIVPVGAGHCLGFT